MTEVRFQQLTKAVRHLQEAVASLADTIVNRDTYVEVHKAGEILDELEESFKGDPRAPRPTYVPANVPGKVER